MSESKHVDLYGRDTGANYGASKDEKDKNGRSEVYEMEVDETPVKVL